MIIEICATSVESITNAQNAGAHRIELCQEYAIGGVTPSKEFLEKSLKISSLPINILIRPRGGDFVFSDNDYELMIQDIETFKKFNISGFVVGFMDRNKHLNSNVIERFRRVTDGYELTFHRAFDFLENKQESIELLIEQKFDRILCSGHELSAEKGLENLRNYNKISNGRITIMPGGGVNLDNFQKFKKLNFTEIHLSAINLSDSPHSNFNIIKEIVELSK
ncbi:MAG: copper homeostasis protein CutC [Bacteroidetes bacterium]|nr:copper homeostasis protein CutC [Cryomorphaceae bacterium]MBL6677839.1 copper homeostasis protein CutC [Flavobacteriaceae bacterium]MDA0885517.1 copper homeostasis protein CutC [Bacteroidota bacterium]